jgi:hypothetical protein
MDLKHTPGPWHAVKYATRTEILARRKAQRAHTSVALVYGTDDDDSEQADANANIIAAGPDMLDALQSFPGFTDNATVGDAWIEKMRAAIAKATGEA